MPTMKYFYNNTEVVLVGENPNGGLLEICDMRDVDSSKKINQGKSFFVAKTQVILLEHSQELTVEAPTDELDLNELTKTKRRNA